MTYGWIVGIIAAVLGGLSAWHFRKGGAYNPVMPIETPLDDAQPPVPVEAPQTVPEPPHGPSGTERVYTVAKASLGRHLTLNPHVPEEEGCAQALSVVLKTAGYTVPSSGISTVNGLIAWMTATGFIESNKPSPGCVITAHSANPKVTTQAHAGVVLKFGIGSNDSRPEHLGLFLENYSSIERWKAAFPRSVTRYFIPC